MKGMAGVSGTPVQQKHHTPPTKSGLRLIQHLFLPTQLPSINVDLETQIDDELLLLSEFFDCLSSFDGDAERINKTRETFGAWNDVQENLDPPKVTDRIRSMCRGDSFAAYIRRQNCGFMITILDPLDGESGSKVENGSGDCKPHDPWVVEQAAISTFPVSLKCARVTESSCGSFASVFPHVSAVVPKKQLLNSKALVRQLKDLSFFDMREAASTARKGGTEVLESRDVTDPLYVSKWIVSVLCDKKSRASSALEVPRVVKKMRDVVLFKEGIPWRRCGMWMTIKAVLHISLQKELGKINGLVVYKLILLKFLIGYLNKGKLRGAEDWLVSEMMAKIGRRVWKLEKVMNSENETRCNHSRIERWVQEAYCELLCKVEATLRAVRVDVLENSLELRIANGKCFVEMRNLKLHVHHSLSHSNFDLLVERLLESQDLKKRFERVGHDIAIPIPPTPLRHRDPMVLFDPHSFEMPNEETGIVLCDFEGSIIYWESFELSWTYVWTVFSKYIETAREFYRNDPIGTSRMILSLLKVIKIWDKIVCKKFPIVQQHRAGVDLQMCADLILPLKGDLESLQEIEGYFGRRDQLATFPSLVEEMEVTVNSFAARFGGWHDTMKKTRDHIIAEGKIRSQHTLQQVEEGRKCSEKLLADIRCRECEYEVENYKLIHKRGCEKCRLEKRERSLSVQIYETPLPTGLERQNAVVFELLIPSDIAALRDLLYMFALEVSTTKKKNDPGFYGPWSSYCQINSCNRREQQWKVDLMSTKKLVVDTHYRSLHPSNPDSDFVKPNGYNCCYAGEGMYPVGLKAGNQSHLALKKRCTLKVEKGSRYSGMQWAINGEEVTPNDVLAMQNTCNRDMSLSEFKEFGSLRTGWKLQWRNLLRALTQCSLSLKEESVFHLICQTVWQAGPRNNEQSTFVRKAYASLGCTGFPDQLLDLLDNIRRKHVDNWKDHYVLLTIILIAQRISSIRPDCIDVAADLIFCCRVDAVKWSTEIQRILSSLSNAPRSEIDDLRVKLIEVNICCALTFPIDDMLLSRVAMNRNDSWETWLCTVARIHDNLVLLGQEYKLSNTVRNLLRRVDEVGRYLEDKIHEECANSNSGILTRFVRSHHAGSQNWQMDGLIWYPYPEALQVYHLKISQEHIYRPSLELQMDIVKGRFLVDGCPVGYLPPTIENHPDFQRVFGNKSFEVQPYGAGYQTGRMITRDLYPSPGEGGSQYSFYLDMNKELTVTEHRRMKGGMKEQKVELISHKHFKKNVPSLLVKKYSHWFNHTSQRFEFFHRDPEKVSKLQQETKKPEYELELDEFTIWSVLDKENLIVDINCPDYVKVLQVIERLEHWKEINMWRKVNNSTVSFTVRLPRMGLSFVVNNVRQGLLVSQEYRGMRVAHVQEGLETLVGLKSGLLLEDAQINSKAQMNSILLVPHGKVMINKDRVTINVEQIRNPPFFAYEVDKKLRQLKAGESRAGWVYLAYLHAVTGQATVDPFTGVTGTERALQILQSGQCWSSEPLDDETVHTLEQIAELSCARHYYPPSMMEMETTEWPYPPNVSNDSFRLVVEKLIKDSLRLHFLHPEVKIPEVELRETDLQLNFKNYWRRSTLTTELGRVTVKFDPMYDNVPTPTIIKSSEFDTDFMSEEMAGGFFISQLVHQWGYSPPPDATIVKGLLLSGKDLKGLFTEEGFPIKEGVYCWSRLLFRDYWLDLYNLARKVKKKDLKAEWTLLLTYFGFRVNDRVSLNHLKLLQTVAVNSELFEHIDPPPFENYSKTSEWVFDLQTLRAIVSRYIRPWEKFADSMKQDQKQFENDIEFGARMQTIHQERVLTQTQRVLDLIGDFWPVDNCDKLLGHSSELSEIFVHDCLMEINISVKNWFQNAQLVKFLRRIEEKLAVLQTNISCHTNFIDRRKALTKTTHCKRDLEDKSEEMLSFIALDDLVNCRNGTQIDENVWNEAKRTFEGRGKQKNRPQILNPKPFPCSDSSENTRLPEFPLSIGIQHKNCPILREYMEDLSESWKLFHSTNAGVLQKSDDELIKNDFKTRQKRFEETLKIRKKDTLERWDRIYTALKPRKEKTESAFGLSVGWRILFESGVFPRIIPLTVLPMLLKTCDASTEGRTSVQWKWRDYLQDLIGAWGVSITLEHQAARCLRLHSAKNESELKAELNSRSASREWSPSEKPEWLLLEIEMDLKVREIQAKVAKRMENSDGEENCLVQLNMGEGKTYVIVPLLVLSLADGSRLCRVTVLKSLYQMNKDSLIAKIGGILLNRRVYSFPCRRDYKIGPDESEEMLEVYQECMEQGGVVMTLPEHRLSFEIKAYERCHARSFEEARGMFAVQAFLRDHARDVLDESDEILHVKYQLVYTLGKQMGVGGGCLRWEVAQDLLQMVPEEIKHLLENYGEGLIEYKESNKSSFPHCRLLSRDCGPELCLNLARKIVISKNYIPNVTKDRVEMLIEFLTAEELSREKLNKVMQLYPVEAHQDKLLTLRGMLACGVLVSCLMKRWRVNYGVNPTSMYRRIAVPFKAKDVASDRVEFGHPDIAIILTHLSYYYSGLADAHLEHVFVLLHLEPDPHSLFESWRNLLQDKASVSGLSGVNLNDFFQKTEVLFPALRHNMGVINFWLSRVVFPHESKQFGWKVGCSPWDLCQDRKMTNHTTTGFSGTNDSKLLLPMTIKQADLNELRWTNGGVMKNLLQQERYEALPMGISGRDILNKLVLSNIRVLIDVGALMLELSNEQVAQEWLKLLDKEVGVVVDAAVYFDEGDKLTVIDKQGIKTRFELSTYRTRLDRCVVYLDDVHTRGTDLKIPHGNDACVTLGKGVTKDKLVQGCMRMRKLGDGHSVVFWASQEVDNLIKTGLTQEKKANPDEKIRIGPKEVLEWTIKNNCEGIREGFIHWASAGVYQAQKLSSLKLYNDSNHDDSDLVLLAENCSQKEQVDLKAMYGEVRTKQKFPIIVGHLLKRVERELGKLMKRSKPSLRNEIPMLVEFFGKKVIKHSESYVGDLLRSTQLLDEEQERELEHEQEAEYDKELPGRAKSCEHAISDDVTEFLRTGRLNGIERWALKIPLILKSSSLWSSYASDIWAKNVYATYDFSNVIRQTTSKDMTDNFLRPVNWIVSVQQPEQEKTVLLLISPFEAEFYYDLFRFGKDCAGSLHMWAPRVGTNQSTLFENPALTLPYNPRRFHLNGQLKSVLLVFSGSSYFKNESEMMEYCWFTGFCPRPWGEEEEKLFNEGGIVDGFVKERGVLKYYDSPFQDNPEKLIRGITQRRFGTFSMDSHVGRIVFQGTRPVFDQVEEIRSQA